MKLSTYIPTKNGRLLVRTNIHSFFHEKMREARTFLVIVSLLIASLVYVGAIISQ